MAVISVSHQDHTPGCFNMELRRSLIRRSDLKRLNGILAEDPSDVLSAFDKHCDKKFLKLLHKAGKSSQTKFIPNCTLCCNAEIHIDALAI